MEPQLSQRYIVQLAKRQHMVCGSDPLLFGERLDQISLACALDIQL